ncbi:MAG TPA: hypothetical protein VH083_07210 [Myxococcales bacterium]|jgi:tetratricopeptide (TPR) repeat protein|nr:hypothetical protein [Myxococcales bacterium]
MPWLLAMLLAMSSAHRAKAERAEAVGHMPEAAHEYEAAYEDDRAPELLFRLGVVRRKLKQFAKAREAFRAYLGVAPEGALRQEVERQLTKLDVLVEAQTEDFGSEKATRPLPPLPTPVTVVVNLQQPELRLPPPEVHLAALPPPPAPLAVPILARREPSFGSRAAPYLAAGALATLGAGGYLWWDGNRLSHAIDSRYTSGSLSASDQPLYGRAHNASLAGRALVLGGALLTAGAVVLW